MKDYVGTAIFVAACIGFCIYVGGWMFLWMLGGIATAGAVVILTTNIARRVKKNFPAVYMHLSNFLAIFALASVAIIIVLGMFHSCTRESYECSSNAARFGLCE